MSGTITAKIPPRGANAKYTIEHYGKCILITGDVPMSAFGALTTLTPKNSVMDPDAARMLECTFAFGPADELDALKSNTAEVAFRRERASHKGLSDAACKWLASGERGTSSNYIFTRLTGIDAMRGWSTERDCHPFDPSDFRRCETLLEQVPELRDKFMDMREASHEWHQLVDSWTAIIAALDEEAPGWRDGKTGRSAPKAYNLIRAAIGRTPS